MTGHFIVIDGPDGAGKGTQIDMLKGVLPHRYGRPDSDFVFTREPGGSPFAEKIRELILSPGAKEASGAVMVQLFGAARFEHLEQTVVPALDAGKVVVSDRFDASTYAYQLIAQKGGRVAGTLFHRQNELVRDMGCFFGRGWATIVLDVPAEIGMARSAKRRGQAHTHFDSRDTAFHELVRDGYKRYAHQFLGVSVIDASRTPCLVHHDVIAVFDRILGGPSPLT